MGSKAPIYRYLCKGNQPISFTQTASGPFVVSKNILSPLYIHKEPSHKTLSDPLHSRHFLQEHFYYCMASWKSGSNSIGCTITYNVLSLRSKHDQTQSICAVSCAIYLVAGRQATWSLWSRLSITDNVTYVRILVLTNIRAVLRLSPVCSTSYFSIATSILSRVTW